MTVSLRTACSGRFASRRAACLAVSVALGACGRAGYGVSRDAGLDAVGLDAMGLDAMGLDAMGLDAPAPDAFDLDALEPRDANERDALREDSPADLDGGGFVLDPLVLGCRRAESGPFVEAARFSTPGEAYGVWFHAPFVLVADTTGGFSTFSFDGTSFSMLARVPTTGWTEAIWNRGDDIFVAAPGTGLSVFRLDGAGTPIPIDDDLVVGVEARRGSTSGEYVYVPSGGAGLLAYRFEADVLTPTGTALATTAWSQGTWTDAVGRIYLADGDSLRVLSFDGAMFSEIDRDALPGATRVWGGVDVVYVAHRAGVSAYAFDGVTLTSVAAFPTAGTARDVWSDGATVFVAAEGGGVYALSFAGSAFALLDRVDTDGMALGVVGDGQHLYVGDQGGGIKAYDGFRCLEPL